MYRIRKKISRICYSEIPTPFPSPPYLAASMVDLTEKPVLKKHERVNTAVSLEYGTPENPGYHTLSSLMGRDGEYTIFRKFSSLNTLNLIRYQAELLDLEHQYDLTILKNEKGSNRVPLARSFKELNGSTSDQKRILDEIRIILDEYSLS
jgi:hypothetical protein